MVFDLKPYYRKLCKHWTEFFVQLTTKICWIVLILSHQMKILVNINTQITVFRDMMPRSLVDMCYHFECIYCLHLQGKSIKSTMNMEARIITQKTQASSKC
jgi:hypothetical protein